MYANNIVIFNNDIFADVETSVDVLSGNDSTNSNIEDSRNDNEVQGTEKTEEESEIESGTLSTYDYQHYVTNRLDVISYSLLILIALIFMLLIYEVMRRKK